MEKMKLYHTSNVIIETPDIKRGRENADFGQGFYLTTDYEFCKRWILQDAYINEYELELDDLHVIRFERDQQWFDYIFNNRRKNDKIHADVIIGPIANDTIYETYGVLSSGFIQPSDAAKLLQVGPQYTQVAIKSSKARKKLKWIKADFVPADDGMKNLRFKEEETYQKQLSEAMEEIG
jgi:hypothetical protein